MVFPGMPGDISSRIVLLAISACPETRAPQHQQTFTSPTTRPFRGQLLVNQTQQGELAVRATAALTADGQGWVNAAGSGKAGQLAAASTTPRRTVQTLVRCGVGIGPEGEFRQGDAARSNHNANAGMRWRRYGKRGPAAGSTRTLRFHARGVSLSARRSRRRPCPD